MNWQIYYQLNKKHKQLLFKNIQKLIENHQTTVTTNTQYSQ